MVKVSGKLIYSMTGAKNLIHPHFTSDETPMCQLAALDEAEFEEKVMEMQDEKWTRRKRWDAVLIVTVLFAFAVPLVIVVCIIDRKIKELMYMYRINRNIKYKRVNVVE